MAELQHNRSVRQALTRLLNRASQCIPTTAASSPNVAQAQRSLSNAWATETLLRSAFELASEDELVRISNHWGVVQLYYVNYHLTQALAAAKGADRSTTHTAVQNSNRDYWVKSKIGLLPWSLGLNQAGWTNLPPNRGVNDAIHVWTACTPANDLDLVAKGIRTTRQDALADSHARARDRKYRERVRAWIEAHPAQQPPAIPRPRLTPAEQQACDQRVGMRGLIDYLYRLRVKTNYEDPTTFTEGPTGAGESETVLRDLVYIAEASSLVSERWSMQLLGRARVTGWMLAWAQANIPTRWRNKGLNLRLQIH